MNIVISLDYEIFFGTSSGSIEKTLIEPTDAIAKSAEAHGAKLALFVDAGFLIRLREASARHPAAASDHRLVIHQLQGLVQRGHEIQLHIHPHWEDSDWTDGGWRIDTTRYKLHDFSDAEVSDIVNIYTAELNEISGPNQVIAYRAGGWVIQPFHRIAKALAEHGISIDSTVYRGGVAASSTHKFDFRDAPDLTRWQFSDDPLVPVSEGRFLELPIASYKPSALFYWQLAWTKKFGGEVHSKSGDGLPVPLGKADLLGKLFGPSMSVVSIDGLKASFLGNAYDDYRSRHMDDFVIIGHPKMLSRYALEKFDEFLRACNKDTFSGYIQYRDFIRSGATI